MSSLKDEATAIGDARNGASGDDEFEALAVKAEEAAEAEAAAATIDESVGDETSPVAHATALDDWDDDAALMLDLADAMHSAATARHARALELVERRREAHVKAIRERAEEESATAQSQAERDVTSIVEWAEAEISRIQAEKVRRGEARERELDALLDRHRAQIEWEIEAVEDAVQAHRANLDSFYTRLSTEPDAGTIARLAADAPQLPDLESISSNARARSVAFGATPRPAPLHEEPAPVAVMDTVLPGDEPAADMSAGEIEIEAPSMLDLSHVADTAEPEAAAEPDLELVGVMAPEAMTAEPEMSSDLIGLTEEPAEEPAEVAGSYVAPEPEPVEAAATPERGTLLQAISVLRPTASWWNHGQNESKD
jgi:hypothetical protein